MLVSLRATLNAHPSTIGCSGPALQAHPAGNGLLAPFWAEKVPSEAYQGKGGCESRLRGAERGFVRTLCGLFRKCGSRAFPSRAQRVCGQLLG